MKYALLVHCPFERASMHKSALEFARAVLRNGHSIERLFFYGDGVFVANGCCIPPQDEPSLLLGWQSLIVEHGLDAVVCIAAAIRRGVLDPSESARYDTAAAVLPSEFTLSGLGQLVEALVTCDRLVTFS